MSISETRYPRYQAKDTANLYPPTLDGLLDTVGKFNLPPPFYLHIEGQGTAAGAERGYPEPFVLLEPPAQNPGCSCVVAQPQLQNVFLQNSCCCHPCPCPWTRMRLDPASTPLRLVLLTVLDLCVFFMPDPRLLDPVMSFLNGRTFRCSCCRIR